MATYSNNELNWMAWHTSKLQADGYDVSEMNSILTSLRKNFDIQLEQDLLNYFPVSKITNSLGNVTYANQNIILNPKITITRTQGVFDKNSAPDRFEEMLAKTLNDCLADFYEIYQNNVNNITDAVKTVVNAPFTMNFTKNDKTYSLDIVAGSVDSSMTYKINLISTDGTNPLTDVTTATNAKPIFVKLTASDTSTTTLTAKGGTIGTGNDYTITYSGARTITEQTAPFMLNLSANGSVYSLEISEGTVNTSLFYTVDLITVDGTTAISDSTTATESDPVYVIFNDGTKVKAISGTVEPASVYAVTFAPMDYTVKAPFTLKLTSAMLGKTYSLNVTAGSYESNLTYKVTLISTNGVNPISEFTQATSKKPVYVKLTASDNTTTNLTAFSGTVDVATDYVVGFAPAQPVTELNAPFKLSLNNYDLDITEGTVNTDLTYEVQTIYTGVATVISSATVATMEDPVFVKFTDGTILKATYGTIDVDTTYTVSFGTSTVDYAPFNFTLNDVPFETVEGAVDTTKAYTVNLVSTDGINGIIIDTSASILNPIFVDLDDGTQLKIVNGTVAFNAGGYTFAYVES